MIFVSESFKECMFCDSYDRGKNICKKRSVKYGFGPGAVSVYDYCCDDI